MRLKYIANKTTFGYSQQQTELIKHFPIDVIKNLCIKTFRLPSKCSFDIMGPTAMYIHVTALLLHELRISLGANIVENKYVLQIKLVR